MIPNQSVDRARRSLSQQKVGQQWWASLGAIVVGTLVLTNWPNYHYTILNGPIPLVYYAFAPILAAVLSMVRPMRFVRAVREPLVIWFVIYLMVGLVWLLIAGELLAAETRQWRKGLLAFAVFSASLMLASEANRTHLAKIILVCALLASINNWFDFLFPFSYVPLGSEYSNPGRGAGLFINATQAGSAVIGTVVVALPFLRQKYRGPALLLMLLGVYPSFARGSWLVGVLIMVIATVLVQVGRRQVVFMGLLAPVIFAIGLSLHQAGISSVEINLDNIQGRLDYVRTGGSIEDASAEERRYVASRALQMISQRPILGHGIGSTLERGHGRGTHNMYLMLGAEQGVVGMLLYLTFIVLILRKGWRLFKRGITQQAQNVGGALVCMGVFFAVMSLFSHNMLQEPLGMFLLAFLLAAANGAPRDFSTSNAV